MSPSPCIGCKYRGPVVPGASHHIECKVFDIHPTLEASKMIVSLEFMTKGTSCLGENLVINQHGIKNGWAMWPFNFDEIWIEECKFKNVNLYKTDLEKEK